MKLIVRPLQSSDEKAFFEGLEEFKGEELHWYTFNWKPGMSFQEMLHLLEDDFSGRNLPPGRVPHTMLYAFLDGKIIGRVSVRHELNEKLRLRGGHMGYAVAPKFRRRGFATEMVKQALKYCQSLKIDPVMVTCTEANEASWKIIEHFNGRLQDKIWDDEEEEMIRRYWISISSQE
jgi:predicted acetyltransferase